MLVARLLLIALPLSFCACVAETGGTAPEEERETLAKKVVADFDRDGFTIKDGDCNDEDDRAYPGQKKKFATPHKLASGELSFDFDCDGKIERDDVIALCLGAVSPEGESCTCAPGWSGEVPECGATAEYSTASECGFTPKVPKTQLCR